ncbi:HlyD family secretion protein [Photobacterium rosenbergii]|uniref:HlyD family efflux transporter periplasmic adaptor subunit n=1 Tax=Photobacterium rosenbergii TaxID=294936 RepID=A0ABU3ZD82_9GAMM|nr:HlyD family efflux transporter periplasmic adaptor subunit [Photobacterium rosenbergii]MDV5168064.1 HlyD family efflux transporter periplasmic adaptor subunit [Photobacterium rosenbergii]
MKVKFHLNKQHNPRSEDGMRVMYGPAKRGGYRVRWYLILALVVSPLLAMAYYLYRTEFLVIAPAIITSYPVTITSTEKAIVAPLPTDVGKSVAKGQAVLLLKDDMLDAETRFIEQELLKLSPPAIEISPIYRDAIAQSEQNLQKFELIKRNYDTFRKQGHVSDVDYASIISINNTLNNQLNNQKLAYIEAQRHLSEMALAGPVSQAHRALMQELVIKRSQQDNLTVRSPFDGRVIEIHVLEGERIDVNRPLITVAKNNSPEVIAYLNPKYIKYGQIGTKAKVSFPDGASFAATVSKPLEMVNKLPQQLLSPFEGQPAYLRITLQFDMALEQKYWIEGMAVKVQF